MKHNISDPRFGGVQRLYGVKGFRAIQKSRVLVVGLGGVGSWVAEALVRTGMGQLDIVDYDDVCLSNTNRQVQAIQGNVGRAKVEILKSRFREINPDCQIETVQEFYSETSEEKIFFNEFQCVVDCIDNTLNKEQLAVACRKRNIPLVVVGSAGGLKDPGLVRVADLSRTLEDGMLSNMRKSLRRRYSFPRGEEKFGIPAVFSMEKATYVDATGCLTDERPPELQGALDCAGGLGSSMAVTTTFAMFAVAEVLKVLQK